MPRAPHRAYADALSPTGTDGSVGGRVHTRRLIRALKEVLRNDLAAMPLRLQIFWTMVLDYAVDHGRFPTQAERIAEAHEYRRVFELMCESGGFTYD